MKLAIVFTKFDIEADRRRKNLLEAHNLGENSCHIAQIVFEGHELILSRSTEKKAFEMSIANCH